MITLDSLNLNGTFNTKGETVNKKITLLLFTFLCLQTTKTIKLESSVLKQLDGIWPAMDGPTLYDMAWLIKKYRNMTLGTIVNFKTRERKGMYVFRGKHYSISELAELEVKFAKNPETQSELKKVLHNIQSEFIRLNERFIKQVQNFKPMILKLMHESCTKRNIPNSFMMKWADTQAGHEEESFNTHMTSFVELNKFFNELCNFLGDLFESCPKGQKQYFEIIRKKKAQAKR